MTRTPQDEVAVRRARQQREEAAQSRYGQIRLTVTFERGGRLSYRMMAKRPQDGWKELNVVAQGVYMGPGYPPTFDDALAYFTEVAMDISGGPTPGLL